MGNHRLVVGPTACTRTLRSQPCCVRRHLFCTGARRSLVTGAVWLLRWAGDGGVEAELASWVRVVTRSQLGSTGTGALR